MALPMPETEGDQIELIRQLIASGEAIAFLEKVGGFTGKGQPGSAMFKFGRSFGFILGRSKHWLSGWNWSDRRLGKSRWSSVLHPVVSRATNGKPSFAPAPSGSIQG